MLKPRFTPEIQLGHLVQATVFIFGIGGSVLGAYLSLNHTIAQQDTRIALVEVVQKSRDAEDVSWRSEMRAANQSLNNVITQLSREVADLRVAIANKADRK
jgi:hypothetical protein